MTHHFPAMNSQDDSALVQFWNETLAPKFNRYRHILVDGMSHHSDAVIPALALKATDNILDVGCGFGDTAIALADRVGPKGHVLGVDCCDAFLKHAWEAAEQSWSGNLGFARLDVEKGVGQSVYDLAFSRFGTMFFTNPVAGLRAIRQALKPGGQIAHIVWRARSDNPWLNDPAQVVAEFLPAPGQGAATCGPGPFSMADISLTQAQMHKAGFVDIDFQRTDAKVLVGRNLEEAIAFQMAIGPVGEIVREAGALATQRKPQIENALAELFASAETDARGIWMNSSSWLITARRPA